MPLADKKKYDITKAQGLLKEYGAFLQQVIDESNKEFDAPIIEDTAEKVGLEYSRRLASKQALKGLILRINTKANERN